MTRFGDFTDIAVELDDHIATVEIQRGPHNYFDVVLIRSLARAFQALEEETPCRTIVLAAEGKSFCAGAQLGGDRRAEQIAPAAAVDPQRRGSGHLYQEAVCLFERQLPVVAAVQGAAVGGGLGLALVADFRVACPEARFSANFARLGFHHGFGLTVTLPELVGRQAALDLLYTGRRVKGEEALTLGLCDHLVPRDDVRSKATEVAAEIAASAPLAIRSIRKTLRAGLVERIRVATDHELVEQDWLRQTRDFQEGVKAMAERRLPDFEGR